GKKYDAVFVGRLSRTKGVYDLLDIWEQVCKVYPQASLAVVGGGPATLRVELKKLAGDKGLAENIDFLGFVSNEKKYAALKSAQVFLLTSHEEGWGIVVAEAMVCGLPVVGYDLDIFGAVYKRGFLTAPLFDTQAFAKQVLTLLGSSSKHATLASQALAESARFDNSLIASQFAKTL
ncbi:MAG: glycosyltransferase, partial [bacterium]